MRFIKPKLQFNEIILDEPAVLYGSLAFGEIEYALKEFLDCLTFEQIVQLKRRLNREIEERMSD